MKIAVVGAGFAGLTAALRLSGRGHRVTVFESSGDIGGLAGSYKRSNWNSPVEQHYHHWFTNDTYAIGLIRELGLGHDLIFPKSVTSIYYRKHTNPFNSPLDVLRFTPLSFINRLRLGLVTAYLKALPASLALSLEHTPASTWLKHTYGKKNYEVVWEPLLTGKFGPYADTVNMSWFWARIKKRTPRLGYLKGGYARLLKAMTSRLVEAQVLIRLNTPFNPKESPSFDRIIMTTPTPVFLKLYPDLPKDYKERLSGIPHLHALNLLLVTRKKVLPDVYWLNVNDRAFPFIAAVQQTNLMEDTQYGGDQLAYIGNYLPEGHSYLKMSRKQLLDHFLPFIKKINPDFSGKDIIDYQAFKGAFAQPVFPVHYSRIKPDFTTPVPNVYLSNMDMVYPWDRGTNYAIELGEKVAEIVEKSKM